ncbi:TlpA disulfide reductase family protein [Desertivirga arenae]|uniref:TlpA disulfide reductase family protein n=1 Tax=Desertivirga arenae TaxID=2810309 RepID=UPI001A973995|nr:TlpA disulfide reductase family protein [Pedobacter sp. SYSU D00823]
MNYGLKLLTGLIISTLPGLAFAQGGQYNLSGKVAPLPASAKAYLYYESSGTAKTDSTLIKDGSFSFSGNVKEPGSSYLIINPKGMGIRQRNLQSLTLYLEPGKITITSPDSLPNAKIAGGVINKDNESLQKLLKPVKDKMDILNKEYAEAAPEKKKSDEFVKSLQARYAVLEDEQKVIQKAFIKSHPSSALSLFTVKEIAGAVPDVSQIEPLFNSLSASVRASAAGKAYAEELIKLKTVAVGAMAPEFSLPDTLGKQVSLRDFRGKYVLIDFWASWCGPCRAENPNVVKAFNAYKSKGFEILGVSLDQPNAKDRWMKAIHDDGLTWTQLSDLKGWKSEAAALYSVRAIPQNFLVDPSGKIVATNVRGEELEKTLSKLLGKI